MELTSTLALQQPGDVFSDILREAGIGTWRIVPESDSIILCPTAKAFFNCSPAKVVTLFGMMKTMLPQDARALLKCINESCRKKSKVDTIIRVTSLKDKSLRWLKVSGKYIIRRESEFEGELRGTITDITAHKLEELRKDDYIALLNHELKSPLSTIRLYVQMIIKQARSARDQQTVTVLERAETQVGSMSRMIDNFLTTSLLSNARLELFTKRFDLLELLQELSTEMQQLYPNNHFELCFSQDVMLCADRDKIAQVLINYMSNAVKYSAPKSRVVIDGKIRGRNIEISVTDEGRGINTADQKRVFDRFYRTNPQGVKGFGLGLFLVKEIISSHQGKVWLESEYGKGSSFYFSLPLTPAANKQADML